MLINSYLSYCSNFVFCQGRCYKQNRRDNVVPNIFIFYCWNSFPLYRRTRSLFCLAIPRTWFPWSSSSLPIPTRAPTTASAVQTFAVSVLHVEIDLAIKSVDEVLVCLLLIAVLSMPVLADVVLELGTVLYVCGCYLRSQFLLLASNSLKLSVL